MLPRPSACSPAEAFGRCPDVGALPSRSRGRSWALRSSIRCSSFRQPLALPSSFRQPSAPLPGRPVPVRCSPAGGSSPGSRRLPPLPHWTQNGSRKNGSTSNCVIRSIRSIRLIHSACGALRWSCGRPRCHRSHPGSGPVPVLPASPRWLAWQPSGAVILGRDDLAATNRGASADSTPQTCAARFDDLSVLRRAGARSGPCRTRRATTSRGRQRVGVDKDERVAHRRARTCVATSMQRDPHTRLRASRSSPGATRSPRAEAPRGSRSEKSRRRPTLPGGLPPSTIGAGGLNCRVRNGNGCFPAAMATGNRALGGSPHPFLR